MSENKIKAGIAADDGAAIHYIDQDILRIVSSRPDARAYRVYFDGEVKEEVLEAEFLG